MNDSMTAEEARTLLDVQEPIPVAWTSKDGTKRDDDGNRIDERQTVPWVWALGPFGTWPETLDAAEHDLRNEPEWWHGESYRLGWVVVYKRGWGYSAKPPVEAK